jgi:hypothetical protein
LDAREDFSGAMNMKAKPSAQPGHVVFDVSPRDVPRPANTEDAPEKELKPDNADTSGFDHLDERATCRTRVLEEILSRPRERH